MTIAIDFIGTELRSGTKSYNINFCKELQNHDLKEDIVIYLTRNYFDQLKFEKNTNSRIKYIVKSNILSNIVIRILWMQLILPFNLKISGVKKLYSPMNICPLLLKIFKIKIILGIHSNLPWVYFNLMPGNIIRNFITKKIMELSILMSNVVIFASYYAKDELSKILNISKNKCKVVYLGIDEIYFKEDHLNNLKMFPDKNDKYIISVLSCVKYHNILNLLKAFKILLDKKDTEIRKFILIMQILDKHYFKILSNYISSNFKKNEITIINNLNSDELKSLYKNSQLYIFSSYTEVFGLTSLEAMTQRCPVLVSDNSALPEINGNSSDYFNPDDVVDIKDKMKEILLNENHRNKLIQNSKIHVKKFTWKKNVMQTLNEIYNLN
tara:strand:- start:1250 stop:2395 length:1146 start_codon:yes stop_codon:yes gene_type:complete